MKRPLSQRLFRATCVLVAPFVLLGMIVWGWIGMIVNEVRGK